MDKTPWKNGYVYLATDTAGFYADIEVSGQQKRIHINKQEIMSSSQPAFLDVNDDWDQILN